MKTITFKCATEDETIKHTVELYADCTHVDIFSHYMSFLHAMGYVFPKYLDKDDWSEMVWNRDEDSSSMPSEEDDRWMAQLNSEEPSEPEPSEQLPSETEPPPSESEPEPTESEPVAETVAANKATSYSQARYLKAREAMDNAQSNFIASLPHKLVCFLGHVRGVELFADTVRFTEDGDYMRPGELVEVGQWLIDTFKE